MSLEQEKKRIADLIKEILGGKGYLPQHEIVTLVGHGDAAVESKRGTKKGKNKESEPKTEKGRVVLGNRRLVTSVIRDLRERGIIKRRTTYSPK